ncbi:MAG: 30S ribosomal protein S3 [Candidatus Parcubacteria bacterium]|nr:MAG: 30S ribosomal protein S3 [Candidatus Parcubacteria bacterium]
MGQKIPPYVLRLGINNYWRSRWIFRKFFPLILEADYLIRKIINENFPKAGITNIIIERKSLDHCKITIYSARPGILVGKEGQFLKNLIKKIEKKVNSLFKKQNLIPPQIDIDVIETKKPLLSAAYLAELAANEIEKGIPTRRVLKKIADKARQQKEILGFKAIAKGRVDGATIKRKEQISWGRMPLSKFIADIDYAQRPVLTKYGIVGLKIWLYKGDKEKVDLDNVTA